MKKILIILLSLVLFGCSIKEEKTDKLSIVVPTGAPSLAFYDQLDNDKFNTGDAQSIMPELKSDNGSDIIVIDTVNGIKALNSGAKYKLAANITFGNFFIASTDHDKNGTMDEGDYIVVFSQGATPDLIFHYIYGDDLDSSIHYVQAVTDAATCLIKGINILDDSRDINEEPYVDYVMIAEPALTTAMAQNEKISIYANMQQEYMLKSDGNQMIQASVFVSDRLTNKQIDEFLASLKEKIDDLAMNAEIFAEATSSLSDAEVKEIFGIPNSKIATKVIKKNLIGLGFKNAYYNKEAIDEFVSIFGLEKTNEEIYYK